MKYDTYGCQISIADILREYKSSEPFREQLDSGRYVYAENRLCLNHPKYIDWQKKWMVLTDYARAHEFECCLVFTITTIEEDIVYEQLSDGTLLALKTQPKASAPKYQPNPAKEREHIEKFAETSKDIVTLIRKLPRYFPEMLDELIKNKGVKEEDLAEQSNLSEKTIQRLRNQDPKGVKLETLVQLCIGLHLHPILSGYLLQAAGQHFMDTTTHVMYKFLLDTCYEYSVEECNALLESQGYGTLGQKKK